MERQYDGHVETFFACVLPGPRTAASGSLLVNLGALPRGSAQTPANRIFSFPATNVESLFDFVSPPTGMLDGTLYTACCAHPELESSFRRLDAP